MLILGVWYFSISFPVVMKHIEKHPTIYTEGMFKPGFITTSAVCLLAVLMIGFIGIIVSWPHQSQSNKNIYIKQAVEYREVTKTFYEKVEQ